MPGIEQMIFPQRRENAISRYSAGALPNSFITLSLSTQSSKKSNCSSSCAVQTRSGRRGCMFRMTCMSAPTSFSPIAQITKPSVWLREKQISGLETKYGLPSGVFEISGISPPNKELYANLRSIRTNSDAFSPSCRGAQKISIALSPGYYHTLKFKERLHILWSVW